MCDRDDDCGDGSDEAKCSPTKCDPIKQFQCSEKYCVTAKWRCDGELDCPDGSDERVRKFLVVTRVKHPKSHSVAFVCLRIQFQGPSIHSELVLSHKHKSGPLFSLIKKPHELHPQTKSGSENLLFVVSTLTDRRAPIKSPLRPWMYHCFPS